MDKDKRYSGITMKTEDRVLFDEIKIRYPERIRELLGLKKWQSISSVDVVRYLLIIHNEYEIDRLLKRADEINNKQDQPKDNTEETEDTNL